MKLMTPRHHCVRGRLCAAQRPLLACVTPGAELLSVDVRHLAFATTYSFATKTIVADASLSLRKQLLKEVKVAFQ
ncbi:hypothetical protein B1B04_12635 [Lysinibacillus sp. KCTC 33748]|nr:hypothetical protein B1B04_12635 [Lysinibacillus sp. KCTC 33748]